jgi:glycosyltransferase involved in cell wall biosynthesis
MRVCLVGDFDTSLDEGLRIVGRSLAGELRNTGITSTQVNIRHPLFWSEIYRFRPDIVHYILSPSLAGLVTTRIASAINRKARTVVSAIHPDPIDRRLIRLFGPDLVIVQSRESEKLFSSAHLPTSFLPNGVDLAKFHPIDARRTEELKKKYHIPLDKFVILHLASMKKERNPKAFQRLQEDGNNYVLIVGRENEKIDTSVLAQLRQSGCTVWIKHFPNIEEIYNLADCYVFPVTHRAACIETPLSVLEAMSCDIPTITTRFGALPRLFNGADDVFFVDNDDEIDRAIARVKNGTVRMRPREAVLRYSWKLVSERLVHIYERLLREPAGSMKGRSH